MSITNTWPRDHTVRTACHASCPSTPYTLPGPRSRPHQPAVRNWRCFSDCHYGTSTVISLGLNWNSRRTVKFMNCTISVAKMLDAFSWNTQRVTEEPDTIIESELLPFRKRDWSHRLGWFYRTTRNLQMFPYRALSKPRCAKNACKISKSKILHNFQNLMSLRAGLKKKRKQSKNIMAWPVSRTSFAPCDTLPKLCTDSDLDIDPMVSVLSCFWYSDLHHLRRGTERWRHYFSYQLLESPNPSKAKHGDTDSEKKSKGWFLKKLQHCFSLVGKTI